MRKDLLYNRLPLSSLCALSGNTDCLHYQQDAIKRQQLLVAVLEGQDVFALQDGQAARLRE